MKTRLLRELPSIDELCKDPVLDGLEAQSSPWLVKEAARETLTVLRDEIKAEKRTSFAGGEIPALVTARLEEILSPTVRKVINASGTILHTNIGRSVLAPEAVEAVTMAASSFVNLEIDLEGGDRGDRDTLVEGHIKRLTGAQAATVVNNNAAAVLLTLNTLAEGREVIISRGELIEIGGSFRLPEIIRKSGAVLKEVGTTNRTHLKDYIEAVNDGTALFFKAHTSNYKITGFTSEVVIRELAQAGKDRGIPVVEDLGSGCLVDLSVFGLPKEPLAGDSISLGADIVTFSGDKLLGGPQAGIIAGKKELIQRIKKNPLKRAMRVDKLTMAALEATLRLYLNPASLPDRLPALKYMRKSVAEIELEAITASALLRETLGEGFEIRMEDSVSVIGGGSMPGEDLPTKVISITHGSISAARIFSHFLNGFPSILGRVSREKFLLDLRTVDSPLTLIPPIPLK